MNVLKIDRGVTPAGPGGATPTFLSTESLTFPGVSLISLGLVQIWSATVGHPATPTQILMIACLLGGSLVAYGLLSLSDGRPRLRDVVGELMRIMPATERWLRASVRAWYEGLFTRPSTPTSERTSPAIPVFLRSIRSKMASLAAIAATVGLSLPKRSKVLKPH